MVQIRHAKMRKRRVATVAAAILPLTVVIASLMQPGIGRAGAASVPWASRGQVKVGLGDGRFTADPPATAPSAQPTAASPVPMAPRGVIARSGTSLTLNGAPYRFTGVNAYELATQWGINAGCGSMLTDPQMDDFFASLRPNSLVRMWAWQGSMTTNYTTHQRDWRPLDRVVAAAARHGQRLVLSLTSQGGECDDAHWKDRAWYSGGFRNAYDDDHTGRTPASYYSYVEDIVSHLAGNPTVGMWEPVNEAEASDCPAGGNGPSCSGHQVCPDQAAAATALRSFFDAVGAEIRRIDPVHLVESGLLGGGQCGTAGEFYQWVSASPGIDVASMHDYSEDGTPLPGDQWNGEQVRVRQAAAVGKPLIVGEMGVRAAATPGCLPIQARNVDVEAKISGALKAGVSGVLVWNWVPQVASGCTFDVAVGDPTLDTLRLVAL